MLIVSTRYFDITGFLTLSQRLYDLPSVLPTLQQLLQSCVYLSEADTKSVATNASAELRNRYSDLLRFDI
jgi:hypothetical protein